MPGLDVIDADKSGRVCDGRPAGASRDARADDFWSGGERVAKALASDRKMGRRGRVGVVKLLRARGGCLGVIRMASVEGCEMSGGAAERALSPEYLPRRGELKHLSTRRKRNQPRFPE
jgi:hypothetical protein